MQRNAWNDIANWRTKQLDNYTKPQLHALTTNPRKKEMGSVGELLKVCSHFVLKCLHLARIGRLDISWSVNKLACAVTKWTRACDKRSARLFSYMQHTCEFRKIAMWETQHSNADCDCFWTLILLEILKDSKSTSGRILCFFRKSHVRANKLDVQETNISFTQFYGS